MAKTKTPKKKNEPVLPVLLGDQARYAGARNFLSYVFVGGKGIGKTTGAKDEIKIYESKFKDSLPAPMKPRTIILDYSNAFGPYLTVQEFLQKAGKKWEESPLEMLSWKDRNGFPWWKAGVLRFVPMSIAEIKEFTLYVFNHLLNAFVIFDESSVFIKNTLPEWQRLLLINHRNKGLEILYIFHKLKRIPLEFVEGDYIHSYRIFSTGEPVTDKFKETLMARGITEEMWEAHVEVEKMPPRRTKDGQLTRVQNSILVER